MYNNKSHVISPDSRLAIVGEKLCLCEAFFLNIYIAQFVVYQIYFLDKCKKCVQLITISTIVLKIKVRRGSHSVTYY